MRRKPKRVIENKIFAKIVRTISFIALAFVGLFITLRLLSTLDISHDIITKIEDVVDKLTFMTSDIVLYTLLGGLLLLLLTQTKKWAGRIVIIVIMLVGSFMVLKIGDSALLTGVNLLSNSQFELLILPLVKEPYVFVPVLLLVVVTIWAIMAYRRPLRLSHLLVRIGAIALFVAFVLSAIPHFGVDVGETYEQIYTYFYLTNYGFLTLGSLFGIIGFFRS